MRSGAERPLRGDWPRASPAGEGLALSTGQGWAGGSRPQSVSAPRAPAAWRVEDACSLVCGAGCTRQ